MLEGAEAPNPFIPLLPFIPFILLFVPKPPDEAAGAGAPNWNGAAPPVGVEGAVWAAPKVKLNPGAPDAGAAGAGADVAPKLKDGVELGVVELKGLDVGATEGVDGAGAPKVKVEDGGVAAAGAPNPPDMPVPVVPLAPKLNDGAVVDVDEDAEPNLAGGSSALSVAERLLLEPLASPKPVLAPDPIENVDPFVAEAPKLKPPELVDEGAGMDAAVDGGEKRLFVDLFSVAAGDGAPNAPGPPNNGFEAVEGVAAVFVWPKVKLVVFGASSGFGADVAPKEKAGSAGSAALAEDVAGAPNEKVDFEGSAGAAVPGLAPKSKVGLGASAAGVVGAAEDAPKEKAFVAGLSAAGAGLPKRGAASAGFENYH